MAIVVPNSGELQALSYFLQKTTPLSLALKLFVNNVTPTEATVTSDLVEASGNGYAAVGLLGSSWDIVQGAPSVATYNTQAVFTFTGALGNVYGYYLTRSDGTLAWLERFGDGPYSITTNGDQIKITPVISMD